ncbi:MAG TPA: S8 family serine peptidase [Steroidobacteraceae bacterium]|nr:S8 family serine peptidase [Steroidobacteraceae bacterium]
MVSTFARSLLVLLAPAACAVAAGATADTQSYACRALHCSTLIPAPSVDDPQTNDCGYRNGNEWWLDYVAGSLAWGRSATREPVTVALFDDGVDTTHPDLRNQLWTNPREAAGEPGVDDDGNGYVDDVHGWDFVDDDPNVAPEGECIGRVSHGTLMASLIAAERNNQVGIAAAGADGARVMVLRIVGCGGKSKDRADPVRIRRALEYATRMGARILSFSAHWYETTPELDAAFAHIADSESSPEAALVIASVPNKGERLAGYPAAYPFRRIVRAVPIGDQDIISPGTSAAPPGLNLGAPSACVLGASAGSAGYRIERGSSNSTAILAGLLAGIWSSPRYARFGTDEFLSQVVRDRMLQTPRRSQPDLLGRYPTGVPLADACTLATKGRTARVCLEPGQPRGPSK